jgi:tetratricopeptide (TPR) repeat protein
MHERLNFGLLLRLLLVTALFGVVYFFVHLVQVNRHARDLLAQIQRFEQEGQLDRAFKFLTVYLSFVPDDADARARLGMMMETRDPSPQGKQKVMEAYRTVLVREPGRSDIRLRLVRLDLDTGEIQEATDNLEVLLAETPEEGALTYLGELTYLKGLCQQAKLDYNGAVKSFRSAIELDPARLESYIELSDVLRRQPSKAAEADSELDRMVAANPKSSRAFVARAAIREQLAALPETEPGKSKTLLQGAAEDARTALGLTADDAEAILLAGEVAQQQGQLDAARQFFKSGGEKHPADVRFWQAQASLEFKAGNPKQSEQVLRAGLERLPDAVDLLWSLGLLLVEGGDLRDAQDVISRLGKTDLVPARLHYLTATLRFREGKWLEAQEAFKSVRPQLANWPELAYQCDLHLGRCYEQTGDHFNAHFAYRRAIDSAPLSVPARFGSAMALLRMNRRDPALAEFTELMSFPNAPAEGWPILARLMIVRNLGAPANQRDWKEMDVTLRKLAGTSADKVEAALLQAEVLVAQDKVEQARRLLEETRQQQPKRVDVWVALAGLDTRQGQVDAALRVLDEADKAGLDSAELRLARLQTLLSRSSPDTVQLLPQVTKGLENLPYEKRLLVLGELAEAYATLDQDAEAEQIWNQISQMEPADLLTRLRLFELALKRGDDSAMRKLVAEIRRQERGQGAVGLYAEAQRLLWRARGGENGLLATAREHLEEAGRLRPNWPAVPSCLAQIDELEDNSKQAIEHYLKAHQFGDRRLTTIRRLVQLLHNNRRPFEADKLMRELTDQYPFSPDMQRLLAENAIRGGNYKQALEAAKKAVANSKDYRDFLWLGQLYWAAGQAQDAETPLDRALKLAPEVSDAWVVKALYLARTEQKNKAEELIREARAKLPKDKADLALAQCQEILGKMDEAKGLYQRALEINPDASTHRSVASFYLRAGQMKEAEPVLRNLLKLKEQAPVEADWARRTLGVLLAAAGNPQQFKDAMALFGMSELIDSTNALTGLPPAELQARALALSAQTDRPSRLQAIRHWEELSNRQLLTADEQFVLASLYEFTGSWVKAREQMRRVLLENHDDPRYLASFVNSLVRHNDPAEAELWLAKLQQLPNQAMALATVAAKARLLALRGQVEDVLALLRTYLDDNSATPAKPMDRQQLVADFLYKELAEHYPAENRYAAAATDIYRKYLSQKTQSQSSVELAPFLARQGDIEGALEVCERAWRAGPSEKVANAMVSIFHEKPGTKKQYARVEALLEPSVGPGRPSASLQICLADLRDLQGRYTDAETLYQQVLVQDRNNMVALNNLAWLLANHAQKPNEAISLINSAIEANKAIPELLDTRALVYLAQGDTTKAIGELEPLVVDPAIPHRVLASLCFHLARAYQRAGRPEDARAQLKKARAAGLRPESLHELERQLLSSMENDLEQPTAAAALTQP